MESCQPIKRLKDKKKKKRKKKKERKNFCHRLLRELKSYVRI
jgi:hypothetical protein